MGVKDLKKQLENAMTRVHLSNFRGWTVAVDLSIWYYKGMGGKNGRGVQGIQEYIKKMMIMLQSYGIRPIGVFDGPTPQLKLEECATRRAQRSLTAHHCLPSKGSVEMTQLQSRIQTNLSSLNIPTIIAPGEADPMLAYLSEMGIAHLIITEDTDLVVLGCARVLYSLNWRGFGDYFEKDRLHLCFPGEDSDPFDFDRFQVRCLLHGTDYLKRLKGMGPKTIDQLMSSSTSTKIEDIIQEIPRVLNQTYEIPGEYIFKFHRAQQQFNFPVVYDPIQRKRVYLRPLSNELENENVEFLGDLMEGESKQIKSQALALGNLFITQAAAITLSFWSASYRIPDFPAMCAVDKPAEPYQRPPRPPSKCHLCGREFIKPARLEDHLRTHTREKPYKCYFCGREFSVKTACSTHLLIHSREKAHKCEVCHKRFSSNSYFKVHSQIHSGEKPHKCLQCEYSTSSKSRLTLHSRAIHSNDKSHKCYFCYKAFKLKQEVFHHLFIHTMERALKCALCGRRFLHNQCYRYHVLIHTGIKPYKCTLCEYSSASRGSLNVHIRRHTGEKNFICQYCNNRYLSSSQLLIHRRTHTGEKPSKCKECGKSFKTKYELKLHLRVHTGEKPFKCAECDCVFSQRSGLSKHFVAKHTNEKPHQCPKCPSSFAIKSNLNRHVRTQHV